MPLKKVFVALLILRPRFFLLKGKENFFAGFCSERAGGGASLRLGIPPLNPPAEPPSRESLICSADGGAEI